MALSFWFRQPARDFFGVHIGAQASRGETACGLYMVGGQISLAERDGHGERAAPVNLSLHAYAAAVQPDQFLHQREADAAAFVTASARAFDAVEPFEQVRQAASGCSSPCGV